MNALPINPITGKYDGIIYTFGNSKVSIILAETLLKLEDPKKFHKVASKLSAFTDGLKTIANIPKNAPGRNQLALMWKNHYLQLFNSILTNDEGRTFLQNLALTRYKEMGFHIHSNQENHD